MTLRTPLREHLESTTDEARISRMWADVKERRDPGSSRRVFVGAGLALAAAALLGVATWRHFAPAPQSTGSLRLANGTMPSALDTDASARTVELTDGSSIRLAPDSELVVVQNDSHRFSSLLASGRARFSVKPGGQRRWVIEGGFATVEVVGTVFTVDRRADGVRVSVERGIVLVRGERVPDRVRRLTRGQDIFVAARSEPATSPQAAVVDEEEAPPPDEAAEQTTAAEVPDAPETQRADRPAPAEPSTRRGGSDAIGRALQQADEARQRGDSRAATEHLRRAMADANDPRAGLAAFTLGRIEMDELHDPDRARVAFQRALELGLPSSLVTQARRRLEELDARAP